MTQSSIGSARGIHRKPTGSWTTQCHFVQILSEHCANHAHNISQSGHKWLWFKEKAHQSQRKSAWNAVLWRNCLMGTAPGGEWPVTITPPSWKVERYGRKPKPCSSRNTFSTLAWRRDVCADLPTFPGGKSFTAESLAAKENSLEGVGRPWNPISDLNEN